ncbi:hypothetical protein [Micromonospora sp. SL4-19]|uniref:hypothetical protein n=1 Tax=Micromonospora sp. SL4-19 TaxID=3399129 RepID=UPI003A4D9C2C
MRLVFVHGRSQGRKDPTELLLSWQNALTRGLELAGCPALDTSVEVRMPFYGRRLDELTEAGPAPGDVVRRGPGNTVDPVEGEFVLDIAHRAGITDEEISAEAGEAVVARGPQNWPFVLAAGRLVSRRIPWLGRELLPLLTTDVAAYLTRPHVTKEINGLVKADIGEGPVVMVGHSLGSVVAYWVLRTELPAVDVRLFLTVGSPLGIDVVKRYLPVPLGMPGGVRKWLNAADRRDPVALFSRLDRDVFPADIENVDDIHNPEDNPHGIVGYLSDRIVCTRLSEALSVSAANGG